MPLTGISARAAEPGAGPLCAFTYRELHNQRRLAQRAMRRGRNAHAARALVARIEAELDARRTRRFGHTSAPALD